MLITMHLMLLVLSLYVLVIDIFVLANDSNLPSLHQQPKVLCNDQEKLALLHFKRSFLINCPASSSHFAYPKVKSWYVSNATVSGDCCRWDGVKCNAQTGDVIGLDLSSSCLYGTIPRNSTLFGLTHLRELDLSCNNFNYSEIPSDIGRLYKLTHLNLSNSLFSGQIPLEISKLSSLSLLDLSLNFDLKLGHISLEKLVYNLTRLTQLQLDRVDISSTVPFLLSNRTSLKRISLSNCNLFGEFPANIFLLPNLEQVSLNYNLKLVGYLPEFYPNSPLRNLSLAGTSLSGELPTSVGNLASLNCLHLKYCEFSGKIPASLGNLTKLTFLTLDRNYFSGDLPSSVMNLTGLTTLTLSNIKNVGQHTHFSWLPKLDKLTQLGFINMSLGTEILLVVSNFTRLVYLDLSKNRLTGPLPSWFMNLTRLSILNLSGNQLQGPIPSSFFHLVNLHRVALSFRGSIGLFDSFLRLPNLRELYLSGSLTFSPNLSINSTLSKLDFLGLDSCNLTEFPNFLRHQNELQDLYFSGNNVAGDIPQWFVNITRESLLSLDLSNNLLTGFEQPPAFLPWNNLEILHFNGNKLRGPLPSPPSSMQVYQASNNQFYGVIPKHICGATSLIHLDLSENNLTGQIPSCIGHQLSGSLQVLNLRGNQLSGRVPQTFRRSCKLNMINLSQNQLEGKLPKSLVNCTLLEVLDVGRNRINDTFPSWLGSLAKLQVLVLRHNNFHGSISAPMLGHDFYSLRIIDLSNNFYTGDLPSRYLQSWLAMTVSIEDLSNSSNSHFRIQYPFTNGIVILNETYNYVITMTNKGSETFYSRILTVFRVIDFSSNKFTGRIPKSIGNLRGLQALNLSNNNLVGGIPSSLANITNLESLDLSQNMLSGVIPQELTRLTFLGVFDVSHNRLVGPIPEGKQFNTFDNSSFYGNLALCGAPLSEKCEKHSSPTQQLTNDEMTEANTKLMDWIIRSLGCVSGLVIGYIIGKIYVTDRHHDWFMETFGRRGRSKTRVKRSAQRHESN